MFENLTDKFERAFKVLKRQGQRREGLDFDQVARKLTMKDFGSPPAKNMANNHDFEDDHNTAEM